MSPIERSAGGGGGGGFTNPMTTAGDIIIENAVPAAARLGLGSAGQVLGISGGLPAWVTPPGFEFGYDQVTTASITVSSAVEATGTTLISCAAHTFDGSPVLAELFLPVVQPANTDLILPSLFEGATQISRLGDFSYGTAGGEDVSFYGALRFTPSAGSHTYTVTAFRGAANGIVISGAGGTASYPPSFIRFTKV